MWREDQVSGAAVDTALDGRRRSSGDARVPEFAVPPTGHKCTSGPEPNAVEPSGGLLSNESRKRPERARQAGASSTGSSPEAISAEELGAIRQRLREGFYQKYEVVDAIAEAIRKTLSLDS
jgi:hypothetical protein